MREPDQPVSQQSLSSDDPAVQLILDIVCVRVNLRTDKRFIVIIQTHAAQKEQRMLLVLEQGFKERVVFWSGDRDCGLVLAGGTAGCAKKKKP